MKKLFFMLVILLSLTSYSQSQITFRYTQKKVFDKLTQQYSEPQNETGYFEFHFDKDDMLKDIHIHTDNNTSCYEISVIRTHYDAIGEVNYGKFSGTYKVNKNAVISIIIDSEDTLKRNVTFWNEISNNDVMYNCSIIEFSKTEYQDMNTDWWNNVKIEDMYIIRR